MCSSPPVREVHLSLAPSHRRYLTPFLKEADVAHEERRFHDLRHTFATLMLKGVEHPNVVQEMMGHANINITLDTYSHVLPNMQDEAAADVESALT